MLSYFCLKRSNTTCWKLWNTRGEMAFELYAFPDSYFCQKVTSFKAFTREIILFLLKHDTPPLNFSMLYQGVRSKNSIAHSSSVIFSFVPSLPVWEEPTPSCWAFSWSGLCSLIIWDDFFAALSGNTNRIYCKNRQMKTKVQASTCPLTNSTFLFPGISCHENKRPRLHGQSDRLEQIRKLTTMVPENESSRTNSCAETWRRHHSRFISHHHVSGRKGWWEYPSSNWGDKKLKRTLLSFVWCRMVLELGEGGTDSCRAIGTSHKEVVTFAYVFACFINLP